MPFKCTKCQKIVQSNEVQDCGCDENHFVECPTIHFLHPEGEGPLFSKKQKITRIPGHKEEINKDSPLHIACTTRSGIQQCTVLASLISCPVCMAFLASKRVSKPEPLKTSPFNTDKLDISESDAKILGIQ